MSYPPFEKVLTHFSGDLWFFSVYFKQSKLFKISQIFASWSKLLSPLLTPQLTYQVLWVSSSQRNISAWITKSLGKSQVPELHVSGQGKVVQGKVTQYFFFFLLSMSHCHTLDRLWHSQHDMKWFIFPKIQTFVFFSFLSTRKWTF